MDHSEEVPLPILSKVFLVILSKQVKSSWVGEGGCGQYRWSMKIKSDNDIAKASQ